MSDVPTLVRTGLLSQAEHNAFPEEERREIDATADRLVERYGEAFLYRDRERLRSEIAFVYGLDDPPPR